MLLAAGALAGCAGPQALRDFTTDGCSVFPDGDAGDRARWAGCCVAHDLAYWRGGVAPERRQADLALRHCVLERTARPALAALMYRGVRIGGAPLLPTPFRWAYGWQYGRGYAPLDADARQKLGARLAPLAACVAKATPAPPAPQGDPGAAAATPPDDPRIDPDIHYQALVTAALGAGGPLLVTGCVQLGDERSGD